MELGGGTNELGGAGWSWVKVDGAGWSWVHGLVIPDILFGKGFTKYPFNSGKRIFDVR